MFSFWQDKHQALGKMFSNSASNYSQIPISNQIDFIFDKTNIKSWVKVPKNSFNISKCFNPRFNWIWLTNFWMKKNMSVWGFYDYSMINFKILNDSWFSNLGRMHNLWQMWTSLYLGMIYLVKDKARFIEDLWQSPPNRK